jgi:hypothetical protein
LGFPLIYKKIVIFRVIQKSPVAQDFWGWLLKLSQLKEEHRMRSILTAACCLLLIAGALFAQGDRGTITGTLKDPAGAMVPGATIEAKNSETGAVYQAASTATGNYTLSNLPAGVYQLSATMQGFKQYIRTGITVMVAQILRIDMQLEVGALTDTVTVNADAPLLKTESGDLSHNVTAEKMIDLPGMARDAYAATGLLPGADYGGGTGIGIRVNGVPSNTNSVRLEGQDASLGFTSFQSSSQISVDSIEEVAIQTSNFSAEYGQVGGGFFNYTMKSGSNSYHGSAYEYFRNEALNANTPYTNARPRSRSNNYGFTFGGPGIIPGVYNGRDKTFFFFAFDESRSTSTMVTPQTIPTAAFRQGDFSYLLTGKTLATDPLGRPIKEGTIYDPFTERIVNGQRVRDPFLNNKIPTDRFDSVAAKIQALIPAPTNTAQTNNFIPNCSAPSRTTNPSLKIDHSLSSKVKISGYWSARLPLNTLACRDGLPQPVSTSQIGGNRTHTARINLDLTITPTMLAHFGGGYMMFNWPQVSPPFDAAKELGLKGTYTNYMPSIWGISTPQGGMGTTTWTDMGANNIADVYQTKPTANASLTWVKTNHTYKFGAEARFEGYPTYLGWPGNGSFYFSNLQTGLPSTEGQNLQGGSVGFPYASFLLGLVDNGQIGPSSEPRAGKNSWALFAQDGWKVTPKLTLDYGLRWDYQTYLKEQYGRVPNLSPTAMNPKLGVPGAIIFEGYGPGKCNCEFAKNYPWAFQPRIGLAYRIAKETVLRAGWGLAYGQTAVNNFWTFRMGSNVPFTASAFGAAAMKMSDGVPIHPVWPDYDPGQFPTGKTPTYFLTKVDQNAGRPPRMNMWSIGLQHQITTNLSIEATYVGNRGVWWQASHMVDTNRLTNQILSKNGLDINNANDRALLVAPLNSALAASRGFNKAPYSGFPMGLSVGQALRPFPQFLGIYTLWSPMGKTWYDSLQVKVTKRYSQGLDFTAGFSWQKELSIGAENEDPAMAQITPSLNDVTSYASNKYISGMSRPVRLVVALNYRLPRLNINKVLSWAIRDWTYGATLTYASGLPIRAPYASSNQLQDLLKLCSPVGFSNNVGTCGGTGTFANRVPDQPFFSADLNDNSIDPNKTFYLNPKAWADPAPGQFGTSAAYYNDYRGQRRPSENMTLGRIFRMAEKANLEIRIELTNAFNRTEKNNPTSSNALLTQRSTTAGKPQSGFGYINTGSVASASRRGVLIARLRF